MTAIPNGPGFSTNDASVSTGLRQDAVVTYQKSLIIHLKTRVQIKLITTQIILN
jgi:hypothetical protein